MTCTAAELRRVLVILEDYRDQPATPATLALALRLARVSALEPAA